MRGARPGIFLSFSPAEELLAVEFDRALRARGARTAVDRDRELADGLPSEPVLQDLGACDALVVIWSAAAADDPLVTAHRDLAGSFGQPCLAYPVDDTPVPGPTTVVRADDTGPDDILAVVTDGRQPAAGPRPDLVIDTGSWTMEQDGPHDIRLDLRLADDGTVTGTWQSSGPVGRVAGRWRFDRAGQQLRLSIDVHVGLRPQHSELELQLLEGSDCHVVAEDVHGLAAFHRYRIRRG